MKGTLGFICGVCAAFFLTRLLATLLFGFSPHDAAVFVAVPLILEIIIAIATFIPAQRVASTRPNQRVAFRMRGWEPDQLSMLVGSVGFYRSNWCACR
jgi:hypothetical protein